MFALRLWLSWALLGASPAAAQLLNDRGPPQHRVVHRSTLGVRVNPLGLFYEGRFSYRYRLYESQTVALRDNFVGVGLIPALCPAFARVGPFIEVSPATFLTVWAAAQFVQYFGTFNTLQSFESANANYGDSQLRLVAGAPSNGWDLILGANLQLKVKSVVLRSQARLIRPDMRQPENTPVFFDTVFDVVVPNRGWFLSNDLDIAWQGLDQKLIVGARYTFTVPFYAPGHVGTGESLPDNANHRVGPVLAYTFRQRDGALLNAPTAFVMAQWYVHHRYRTGVETSVALPLIAVGFQVVGDFLSLDP